MKHTFLLVASIMVSCVWGQFAPPVGMVGTTAVHKDSSAFVNWANEVVDFQRGLEDITNPDSPLTSFGEPENALLKAEGTSTDIVSLGDLGSITLSFPFPIKNGDGYDFAVFENSFSDNYLEFAHVEVSTDGDRFVRIPSTSNLSTTVQIGTYDVCDTEKVHNLAGKYRQGYGTPFDLQDIIDSTGIHLDSIQFVRIVDVVGSIDPEYATFDHLGNVINDPFKTDFESGGFDLDAVGVINENNIFAQVVEEKELSMKAYPNPASTTVTLAGNFSKVDAIKIVNILGEIQNEWLVIDRNQQTITLDISRWSKGVYLIQIANYTTRIVVQ